MHLQFHRHGQKWAGVGKSMKNGQINPQQMESTKPSEVQVGKSVKNGYNLTSKMSSGSNPTKWASNKHGYQQRQSQIL